MKYSKFGGKHSNLGLFSLDYLDLCFVFNYKYKLIVDTIKVLVLPSLSCGNSKVIFG